MVGSVSIVIVSGNDFENTLMLLHSLDAEKKIISEVLLINRTGETFPEKFRQNWNLKVIESNTISSYSLNVNVGARSVTNELILVCNDDIIFKSLALSKLVDFIERNKEYSVVAPTQFQRNGLEAKSPAGSLPSLMDYFFQQILDRSLYHPPKVSCEVEYVSGACFLIRRKDFNEVGGMDEKFQLYMEDVDFCRRLRLAGKRLYYLKEAEIVHYGGASTSQYFFNAKKAETISAYSYFQTQWIYPIRFLGVLIRFSRYLFFPTSKEKLYGYFKLLLWMAFPKKIL